MGKIIIIIQARIASTRFPNKVLQKIEGKSILEIQIERLKKCKNKSDIIIATTFEDGVEKIIHIAKKMKVRYHQGDTDNVLDRFYKALKTSPPDFVVRITSDCPLIDNNLVDKIIKFSVNENLDYVSNVMIHNYPDGQDVEVFKYSALKVAWKEAKLKSEKEHVTPYIIKNSNFHNKSKFTSKNYNENFNKEFSKLRMTVDYKSDLDAIKILIKNLGHNLDWASYANFMLDNQTLFKNQKLIRNESYLNQIKNEN